MSVQQKECYPKVENLMMTFIQKQLKYSMKTTHKIVNGDSRKMGLIKDKAVQLVVTSPPYWQLKDYGTDNQIGFHENYETYINSLNLVWKECYRVLD